MAPADRVLRARRRYPEPMTSAARLGLIGNRLLAGLIDVAPGWIWRPANLRLVGPHIIHSCYGNCRRTVELNRREVIVGRRIRDSSRDYLE